MEKGAPRLGVGLVLSSLRFVALGFPLPGILPTSPGSLFIFLNFLISWWAGGCVLSIYCLVGAQKFFIYVLKESVS